MIRTYRAEFTNKRTKETFYGRFSSCTATALSNIIDIAFKRKQEGVNMLDYNWDIWIYTECKPRIKLNLAMSGNFIIKGNCLTIHPIY